MTRILCCAAFVCLVACSGSQTQTDTPTGGTTGEGAADAATTAASTTGSGDGSTGEPGTTTSGGAAGSGGASSGGGTEPLTPVAMVAAADVARGEKLFDENHCKGCHGTRAEPGKKFTNVFKIDWASEKKVLDGFEMIKKGKTPMPGFGDKLDDKAIADIIAFLKSGK
jgi:mono/diheme cytochrome c family protein